MPQAAKIAVIRCEGTGLVEGLRRLPARPEVREFRSYYDEFEQLRAFSPGLLVVEAAAVAERDLGALALVQRSIGGLVTVLCGPREREVAIGELARSCDAHPLLAPFRPADLAAIVSLAGGPADVAAPETVLDLARGISDEINNPLLFASGHLQLIEAALDPERNADPLAQIASIRGGLERIASTMAKIRLLGRARAAPPPVAELDLAAALRSARPDGDGTTALSIRDEPRVLGHPELLPAALSQFLGVAAELGSAASEVAVELARDGDCARVRMLLRAPRLAQWQLPRAFEPYSLNRVLRGTTHGLSLFLVQTIVHAHGGQALAAREADGSIVLDLLLPAAD